MVPVELGGIVGAGPGLMGVTKCVMDRVAYIVGYTVSMRKLSLPPPMGVCIDTEL